MKRLVIFDLDGTLAQSKSPITPSMAVLLRGLLEKTKVAVISGASYGQLATQFVRYMHAEPKELAHLYLLPANGSTLYVYENGWKKQYEHLFSPAEVAEVFSAIEYAIQESKIVLPDSFGDRTEHRGSQITFSALGQSAPLGLKKDWDPDQKKRIIIKDILSKKLNEKYSISIGGTTSIDITKKGFNKHFGIDELTKLLKIPKENTVYIGDALYPGGNDESAKAAGVDTVQVKGPEDTEEWIKQFLNYENI
ncbi:MAG: HAD-IIB family hydrolase [Candidatus Pacebacteria bacterium]|jgi:HAD superfamily hydrolase (TIGR01484 family)|nr:HAD-IIB family hydrolase [Candidatus Paceibacterota bacterium]